MFTAVRANKTRERGKRKRTGKGEEWGRGERKRQGGREGEAPVPEPSGRMVTLSDLAEWGSRSHRQAEAEHKNMSPALRTHRATVHSTNQPHSKLMLLI